MKSVIRSIGAPILGYALIVIGALMFQEGLFGRVTHDSSITAILIGGGLTVVACVVAGYLVAQIAPQAPVAHALPLMIWLSIETTLIHLEGNSPLWFDVLAGGSNVAGVILGVWVWIRRNSSADEPGEHAGSGSTA